MDTKTKVIYTSTKRRTFKHKRSFHIRCGLVSISLLTFFVLLKFYNQLRVANQLLMEIKRRHIASNTNHTNPLNWRENTKTDKMKTSYGTEFDNDIFDQIVEFGKSQNESEFSKEELALGPQDIQRRFQENVYMIRKRFYESHQSKRLQPNDQGKTRDFAIDLGKIGRKIPPANPNVPRETRASNSQIPRVIRVDNPQISRGFNNEKQKAESPRRKSRVGGSNVSRGSRANVVIVAYHRSGSSFLGEMFNRDPNSFYLFEPIHTIDSFLDARRRFPILYDTLIRNLLDTIFKCDFSKHPLFVSTLTTSPFRLKSQALTSEGLCDPRVTSRKMHLCLRINATLLTKLCSSRPHTVIKTIRMAHWENLDFLGEQDSSQRSTPFKVIHLVRDPRGIITSRASWLLERSAWHENVNKTRIQTAVRSAVAKYVRVMSVDLCAKMKNDINDWTKRVKLGKPYAFVRYEDVSREPLTVYKEISEFTGVVQSRLVTGWLENNTKCASDLNYYSTTRNSSAVPHMWRRRLTMPLVEEIQNNCAEVMGILGYKLVDSEKELRDIKESLVVDWGNEGLLRTKPYIDNSG